MNEELPGRVPGAALEAIHSAAPPPLSEVNLFGAPDSEVVSIDRFRLSRLLPVGSGDNPEPAA